MIETLCPKSTERVVAALPIEIFPISPSASFSISESTPSKSASLTSPPPLSGAAGSDAVSVSASAVPPSSELSAAAAPLSNASISACEIISSLISIFIACGNSQFYFMRNARFLLLSKITLKNVPALSISLKKFEKFTGKDNKIYF